MIKPTKVVYTIWLDSGADVWAWIKDANDETMYVGSTAGDSYDWHGEHAIPIELMRDFNGWGREFECSKLDQEDNAAKFNWQDFNGRGLALASRLKTALGEKASVRYVKPSEDPSYIREEGLEIAADGTALPIRRLYYSPI